MQCQSAMFQWSLLQSGTMAGTPGLLPASQNITDRCHRDASTFVVSESAFIVQRIPMVLINAETGRRCAWLALPDFLDPTWKTEMAAGAQLWQKGPP